MFIDALKLRTNTFGTKVALGRELAEPEVLCRRCRLKPETLGHVIGECVAGKRARIERHNWLVGKIAELCRSNGVEVFREQAFTLPDGTTLRPDLVIKHRETAAVVEITLPFENKDSLQTAAYTKVSRYLPALPTIQEQLATTVGAVIPVVVGARGALPRFTVTALKKLGLGDRVSLTDIVLTALRTSIDIARCHMDYVQRGRPGGDPP